MRATAIHRARRRVTGPAEERGARASRLHLEEVRGSIGEINQRLQELGAEWEAERVLEAAASALAGVGAGLTALRSPRWAALSGLAAVALLRHALTRESIVVEVLGRLGMRTRRELEVERIALKAMRGDFRWVTPVGEGGERVDPDTAYVAARA